MQARNDLLDRRSPPGLEVFQITTEGRVPSCHVYMEAQIFTPDSRRFILHRSAHAHGSDRSDPQHKYLLCDLENNGRLSPLTGELGATAPSLAPDGKCLYYFVDETKVGGGRLTLKRVTLDGADRRTIMVLDGPLPGTRFRASHIYPLSTISSDGKRLAITCFLGDGQTADPPYGLLVFSLERAAAALVIYGSTWGNMHPQYSRSLDPAQAHDLLVQENHGCRYAPDGQILQRFAAERDLDSRLCDYAAEQGLSADCNFSGLGPDIHVIRDDGTRLRTMPWGRDGNERCQGHQCWRGRSDWAITSTMRHRPDCYELIESRPVADEGHPGSGARGGIRNILSRDFTNPYFYHFATDISGKYLITDAAPFDQGGHLYFGQLGEAGKDPLGLTWLLNPRAAGKKENQIHPFLSPDGKTAFFNSDESGILQAYLIKGLDKINGR